MTTEKLHTITTEGRALAVTTTEAEAAATAEAYSRAGYPALDVETRNARPTCPRCGAYGKHCDC